MMTIETIREGNVIHREIEIKRSRSLTTLTHTDLPEQARALIDAVKTERPQACHNYSIYMTQVGGCNPHRHPSDDGEPSGTAGTPMPEVPKLTGIWNVTAVITRYFGRILLEDGDSVRACSTVVSGASAKVPRTHLRDIKVLKVHLFLGDAGRIEAELRHGRAEVLDVDWGNKVSIHIGMNLDERESFDALLTSLSSGILQFHAMAIHRIEVGGSRLKL